MLPQDFLGYHNLIKRLILSKYTRYILHIILQDDIFGWFEFKSPETRFSSEKLISWKSILILKKLLVLTCCDNIVDETKSLIVKSTIESNKDFDIFVILRNSTASYDVESVTLSRLRFIKSLNLIFGTQSLNDYLEDETNRHINKQIPILKTK